MEIVKLLQEVTSDMVVAVYDHKVWAWERDSNEAVAESQVESTRVLKCNAVLTSYVIARQIHGRLSGPAAVSSICMRTVQVKEVQRCRLRVRLVTRWLCRTQISCCLWLTDKPLKPQRESLQARTEDSSSGTR